MTVSIRRNVSGTGAVQSAAAFGTTSSSKQTRGAFQIWDAFQGDATATPGPPTPAPPAISLIRYTGSEGPQANIPLYDYIFMSPYRASTDLAYAKAHSPSTQKVLAYQDATSSQSGSNPADLNMNTPVSYEEALAHDTSFPADQWLIRDIGGTPIQDKNYPGDYFMNIGSATYQTRAQTHIMSVLTTPPIDFDGIFFDNMNPGYFYRSPLIGTPPAPTQGYVNGVIFTQANWRAAQLSFLDVVGDAVRAAGYYVCVNGGDPDDNQGVNTQVWYADMAPHINGVLQEYYNQGPDKVMYYNDPTDWHGHYDEWTLIHDAANNNAIDFFGGASGLTTDTAKMMYLKATFLLKWNGTKGAASWRSTNAPFDPYNAAWTTNIGSPSGVMFGVSTGWRRNYSGGTVIVNPNKPTGSSINFPLGAVYRQPDGTLTSSLPTPNQVTLAPVTAMILTTP